MFPAAALLTLPLNTVPAQPIFPLPPFGIESIAVIPQVDPIINECLPLAMSEVLGSNDPSHEERALEVLSCLIKHGAQLSPRQVSLVGSKAGFEAASKCFLDAVCAAVNPLLVGMRLSLLLADAGGMGNEGQRQVAYILCVGWMCLSCLGVNRPHVLH